MSVRNSEEQESEHKEEERESGYTEYKEVDFNILLENYQFQSGSRKSSSDILGREKELGRLLAILRSTRSKGGVYLVSGYRGVGKTCFVDVALDEYVNGTNHHSDKSHTGFLKRSFAYCKRMLGKLSRKPAILVVRINLGNEAELDSRTILTEMISLLYDQIAELRKGRFHITPWLWWLLAILAPAALLLFPATAGYLMDWVQLALPFCTESVTGQEGCLPIRKVYFVYLALVAFIIVLRGMFLLVPARKRRLLFAFRVLHRLIREIHSTTEKRGMLDILGFAVGASSHYGPLSKNEMESRLYRFLNKGKYNREFDIIFVFDELDKLSGRNPCNSEASGIGVTQETRQRRRQVDQVLGELKNMITSAHSRFIFIAGRDMYDAYLSESGSSNSLYESLFSNHIYIPSLLTDHSDSETYLLDSMIESFVVAKVMGSRYDDKKKLADYSDALKDNTGQDFTDSERADRIYILKTLIHLLALHSWGNCKRMISLFESFVIEDSKEQGVYYLRFTTTDVQRLVFSSHLYILFHHSLSRLLMRADDKLVVSAFSIFHFILKFHGMAFSREDINRMYEIINIHSSPELSSIVDIIINKVLSNHIRRIRNSYYRFRFSSMYEQEIHYITTISDRDSATFSFSLDAMDNVKQYYKELIHESSKVEGGPFLEHAAIHVVIGNYHYWEQSYDEALIQYTLALRIMLDCGEQSKDLSERLQQIELCLKQGSVAERMGRYSLAASFYHKAEELKGKFDSKHHESSISIKAVLDSKWSILQQPFWAIWFLNLKRSARHYANNIIFEEMTQKLIESSRDQGKASKDGKLNEIDGYKLGVLAYFLEQPVYALERFEAVIGAVKPFKDPDERACHLGGNACLRAGFSILVLNSNNLLAGINEELSKMDADTASSSKRLEAALKILVGKLKESFSDFRPGTSLSELEKKAQKQVETGKGFTQQAGNKYPLSFALGLMAAAGSAFKKGQLDSHAALAYLSVVMLWEVFLEMIPWRLLSKNFRPRDENESNETKSNLLVPPFCESDVNNNADSLESQYQDLHNLLQRITKQRKWVKQAAEEAWRCNANSTQKAMSHFMKTALRRNMGFGYDDTLFGHKDKKWPELVLEPDFSKKLIYQQYSMFGQMTVGAIHWENMAVQQYTSRQVESVLLHNQQDCEDAPIRHLPYSLRYYAIMLWQKGMVDLAQLRISCRNEAMDEDKIMNMAVRAVVNLYRASQYVDKILGDASTMMLPPIFMISYNLWEVVYEVANRYAKQAREAGDIISYLNVVAKTSNELDERLRKIKDVSSRVLDLDFLEQQAIGKLRAVERMGDANSTARTDILRNKYYLDDDYEDNMFNLDWCYSRTFAPAALIHRLTIDFEMQRLRSECEPASREN